jgi:hypothetical protein
LYWHHPEQPREVLTHWESLLIEYGTPEKIAEQGQEAAQKRRAWGNRGVAIFAKACFGHPSQASSKNHATANACGAPAVLLPSFYSQQGV